MFHLPTKSGLSIHYLGFNRAVSKSLRFTTCMLFIQSSKIALLLIL